MKDTPEAMSTEDIEFTLLLEAIRLRYGYDFREYSEASLRRRIRTVANKFNVANLSDLQGRILQNPEAFAEALGQLTVPTTEMFRDPPFFREFRTQIIPVLRTFPSFKIWHAGCSTGEEVYSLAILLTEAGLIGKAVIYATDISPEALNRAKEGIYPIESIPRFTASYQAAGGTAGFSTYYTAGYGAVRIDPSLRKQVVFSTHNLATDDVFAEVNVIVCRNVFIYFKRELQSRVLNLFSRSLRYKGFLCLGEKETVTYLEDAESFAALPGPARIFQKMSGSWSRAPGVVVP